MIIFSLIVPVYNVEKYLPICLSSVLNQTVQEYEIILINDGSTDSSGILCDQYATKDARVKVIHQKNQGLSAARNIGIRAAQGNYLLFLDSDDLFEQSDFLERIWENILNNPDADIIAFNWKEFSDGENVIKCPPKKYLSAMKKEYRDGIDYLQDAISQPLYPWYAWIYAYRRSFVMAQGFSYPVGKKYEDVALTYKILLKAQKVVTEKNAWYCYRIARDGAITHTLKYQTEVDKLNSVKENIYDIQNRKLPESLKKELCNNFSCLYYSAVIQSYRIRPLEDRKKFWKLLQEEEWICQYTTEKKQKIVQKVIRLFGVPTAATLLNIRRIIKNI